MGGEDELGNINDYFQEGYAALRDSAGSFYPWKHPARLLQTGFYKAAIQTYCRTFVPERVHIVSLEALGRSPEDALAPLSNALGIRLAIPRKDNSRLRSADLDRALRNELATLFHDDWEWVRATLGARYGICT